MASKIPPDYKHNGLTYKEWQAEGRAYFVKNGDIKGWKNRYWIRPDGEQIELYSTKRKSTPADVIARGDHMKPRKTKIRSNFTGNRKEREKVPERLRERFNSDAEFEEYKNYVKRGNERNQKLASQASEGGTKFNKGHIAAVGAGGSHDPMAQRLESERGNKSSQNVEEIPKERLAATGTPSNWDEAVDMYQNPEKVPTELTPQDKQRIWKGEDPEVVKGQRQTMIDENPLARPNPNRTAMLQPQLQVSGGNARLNVKHLAAAGLALPSFLGTAASAMETVQRTQIAAETGNPLDQFQAGVSGVSLAGDLVPVVGEVVSTPADLLNVGIDEGRELFSDPMAYGKRALERTAQIAGQMAFGAPAMKAINGGMKLLFK